MSLPCGANANLLYVDTVHDPDLKPATTAPLPV